MATSYETNQEAYDDKFVRKRHLKIAAIFVTGVCLVITTAMVIISFLGESLGNFTIQARGDTRLITLSEDPTFASSTSLLNAESLAEMYPTVADVVPVDSIDTEGGSHNGHETNSQDVDVYDIYFAYTFFLKNAGTSPVDYTLNIDLQGEQSASNGAIDMMEYLRIRIYENRYVGETESETHNFKTYARPMYLRSFVNTDGSVERRECISANDGDGATCKRSSYVGADDRNANRTSTFTTTSSLTNESTQVTTSNAVVSYTVTGLPSKEVTRYTVVLWLEGLDPDCSGKAPENAKTKFAMYFDIIDDSTSSK